VRDIDLSLDVPRQLNLVRAIWPSYTREKSRRAGWICTSKVHGCLSQNGRGREIWGRMPV